MVTFDARDPGTTADEWMLDPRLAALPAVSLAGVDRVIVVAAHPDDETLGAGALLRASAALGVPTEVVIVTDGSASHPGSDVAPAALAAMRAAEVEEAVGLLNPAARLTFLGFPDGGIASLAPAVHAALAAALAAPVAFAAPVAAAAAVGPGASTALLAPAEITPNAAVPQLGGAHRSGGTVLVCPWRGDGHPDHELVGEVCAELLAEWSATTGVTTVTTVGGGGRMQLAEYPIWLWHWGRPGDSGPWANAAALPVDDATRDAKRQAVAAHRSQVEPLSGAAGDEALLNPTFLQNFDRDREVFIMSEAPEPVAPAPAPSAAGATVVAAPAERLSRAYFDDTYARSDDPWGFTDRWYEERKRAITVACLPEARFGSALEIGCSIGVLTEQLAPRTSTLLSVDIAEAAVARARQRLAAQPHVTFAVLDVARDFPAGRFDLIVLSEVGYYFDAATFRGVLARIGEALADDGVVVVCHWRHGVTDYLQSGDGVHQLVAEYASGAAWTRIGHHLEDDFVLDVFSPDGRSVAERTGLL